MYKCVPITLVTGYLGSGKTTLINNILSNDKGYKMAVIVNDIGEVNIDADLIDFAGNYDAYNGVVGQANHILYGLVLRALGREFDRIVADIVEYLIYCISVCKNIHIVTVAFKHNVKLFAVELLLK